MKFIDNCMTVVLVAWIMFLLHYAAAYALPALIG